MKNLFSAYYTPTTKEFDKLWDECIFSFDTNILLNVYRYSEKTRERLFEIFNILQDRIWIPYQVAYEYHEERLNVISEQLKPYKEIQEVLDEYLNKLNSIFEQYRKRHSFTSLVDEDKIIKTIKRANQEISKTLEETKAEYPNLIENDIYREKISSLFSGKIGLPYNKEELQKVCKQVKSRFEQEQPPGYKDKNKSKDIEKYGDAILWLQLIDYAKTQNKPIIFVTDDNKEDWWKQHKGQTISPRPELIQEMKLETQVDFWMYTGDRFLMYAEEYLKLLEEPEIIEEAKDVRKVNDAVRRGLAKLIQSTSLSQVINNLDLELALDRPIQERFDPTKQGIKALLNQDSKYTTRQKKAILEALQAGTKRGLEQYFSSNKILESDLLDDNNFTDED
ncbi:MAG: PIN domain-containing protein [Waterburya sp.]